MVERLEGFRLLRPDAPYCNLGPAAEYTFAGPLFPVHLSTGLATGNQVDLAAPDGRQRGSSVRHVQPRSRPQAETSPV